MPPNRKFPTPRHARDLSDFDYLDKLSKSDLQFLRDFNDEYYVGRNCGQTKDQPGKRANWSRRHRQLRSIWTRSFQAKEPAQPRSLSAQSDALIGLLDLKREIEALAKRKKK